MTEGMAELMGKICQVVFKQGTLYLARWSHFPSELTYLRADAVARGILTFKAPWPLPST